METNAVVSALAALAHPARLEVFRELARIGPGGVCAGDLARHCGVPANTLSFHLKELSHAGLVVSERDGRRIVYALDPGAVRALVGYLVDDCCGGRPELCLPGLDPAAAGWGRGCGCA